VKLLLINTPINQNDILGNFSGIYKDIVMVPTGMAQLAAFVRDAGVDVRILDEYAQLLPMRAVFELIRDFKPDLIGYGATTPNYFAAIEFARLVRAEFPSITTVFGGIHPTIFPDEVLREETVDYVIRDEGEWPLKGLCEALEGKNRELASIPGLSFKSPSGHVHNPRTAVVNLEEVPFAAYDLLPMHLYSSPSYTKFASPVFQMIASRGCPYACSYCVNAGSNVAARYRRRPLDHVVDEMELLADKYGAKQIQFWDPIFPLGERHSLEFCKKLIDRGLHRKIVWNCTTRPDTLTEEAVKWMARSGCKGVGFGIESGVPELLARVNKRLSPEKVRTACRLARKHGMVVMSGFILGFPGATAELSRATIDFAKSLDLHYAQFSLMIPYPGTPLYDELEKAGEINGAVKNDFIRYNQNIGMTRLEPVWIPKGRTALELKKLQRRAYVEFYLRPKALWLLLPHLRPQLLFGMVRAFLAVLGLFLERMRKTFQSFRGFPREKFSKENG